MAITGTGLCGGYVLVTVNSILVSRCLSREIRGSHSHSLLSGWFCMCWTCEVSGVLCYCIYTVRAARHSAGQSAHLHAASPLPRKPAKHYNIILKGLLRLAPRPFFSSYLSYLLRGLAFIFRHELSGLRPEKFVAQCLPGPAVQFILRPPLFSSYPPRF